MKKLLFALLMVATLSVSTFANYLAETDCSLNMRLTPEVNDWNVIQVLPEGTEIYVIEDEYKNGYNKVINIKDATIGWCSFWHFTKTQQLDDIKGDVFQPLSFAGFGSPEARITNDTSRTLSLSLNGSTYSFSPGETKTITLRTGTNSYLASIPGIIPCSGSQKLNKGGSYTWSFYIKTEIY